ncbi:hypothetical protein [Frondihabitans sp. VKM Ac-2883]|uniref:hypothetical protein n=1 Tax=Frondihabitans sp. VKM Ac-2883 TaxID=2783823 RepID=UPI00188C3369|nr:hypothetical protein [Frondihabitans sp. VKM Ac-2883]MBF4576998.1 hypothetical protein [Frondihabitans sp. VKM Ac-2883]
MVPLISLGLVMGFSPALTGIALRVLTRGDRHPLLLIGSLCLGMVVAATLLLVAFRSVDPQTFIDSYRGRVEAALIRRSVDFVAAALLLLTALVVIRLSRRPRKIRRPRTRRTRPVDLVALGFANTLVSISGVVTMYVTGRVISGLSPDWGLRIAAYGVFVAAMIGPYLVLGLLWERLPGVAGLAARGSSWLGRQDFRRLLAAALAVTGLVFVGLGIAGA